MWQRAELVQLFFWFYSVFNMIYMLLLAGMPGGWLILVCGIYATIYTFKYQSAWQRYQQTGRL